MTIPDLRKRIDALLNYVAALRTCSTSSVDLALAEEFLNAENDAARIEILDRTIRNATALRVLFTGGEL